MAINVFAVDSCIVAGAAELCGMNWEPNTAVNKMTIDKNGIYKKVHKTVLKVTYQLKVTNGSRDQCWGVNGNNYKMEFEEETGVIITFTMQEGNIAVEIGPPFGDYSMICFMAAALVALVGISVLILNK